MVAPFLPDEVKHPLVVAAPIALDVFDRPAVPTAPAQSVTTTGAPSSELAAELDGAAQWLGVRAEELLLAALGRTLGRTRGDGAVAVSVRSAALGSPLTVTLLCAAGVPMGPSEMLQGAHNALSEAVAEAPAEIALQLDGAADPANLPALHVHVRRIGDELRVDWTHDAGRLDDYSVEEMAEQFGSALIEITSDAGAPL
ncbi:hypothetical protein FK535_11310 [Mycolicibacterium sp. 018/SC-01/001]|uniref:hypothetical protein n=1 Tax=Mycolicibacterium sp. 018/SC-01/001 TaxID=2592069 RepID=UPI0011816D96|nr:hypothetical protein [Mycolicibacterium sp. 018/SC-01/001]TRW83246.1 hypothetical protein FK535_11310 [Mycolicibacterium sp. 018/SC-01/001]